MKKLTAARARELLAYDRLTGELRWLKSRGGRRAGSRAGHMQLFKNGERRLVVRIDGSLYLGHRLAWLITEGKWPVAFIDHKNCLPGENQRSNLREATKSQNMANTHRRSNNTSGFKGVSWDKVNRKWIARIRVPGGKYLNLGRFQDPARANAAYAAKALALYGEFARAA